MNLPTGKEQSTTFRASGEKNIEAVFKKKKMEKISQKLERT